MSYTINYSKQAPAEKYERALADAIAWLGSKENVARKQLIEHCSTLQQALFALSFIGLQGFPARVYFRHILRTE